MLADDGVRMCVICHNSSGKISLPLINIDRDWESWNNETRLLLFLTEESDPYASYIERGPQTTWSKNAERQWKIL